jgi:hypothetical protein
VHAAREPKADEPGPHAIGLGDGLENVPVDLVSSLGPHSLDDRDSHIVGPFDERAAEPCPVLVHLN